MNHIDRVPALGIINYVISTQKSLLCPSALYLDMDSHTVHLKMKSKISLVIALCTFASCDEVCENEAGDLFWIDNPVINYHITAESPTGHFNQRLLVDDHNYTLQIKVPPSNSEYRTYYKEGFKSNDKIEVDQKKMLQLIGLYGFKDFDLFRTFGYQPRYKLHVTSSNENETCYYYKCDKAVNNVNCNLTSSTPSCVLKWGITKYPNNFKPDNGLNWVFLGQCQIKMTTVRGNIFHIWLGLAFRQKRPIITVLKNAVELDWKMNATEFPKGKDK